MIEHLISLSINKWHLELWITVEWSDSDHTYRIISNTYWYIKKNANDKCNKKKRITHILVRVRVSVFSYTITSAVNINAGDRRSKIEDRRSKIQDPRSKIQDPRSKIQDPRSKIQDPRSKIQDPRYATHQRHKTLAKTQHFSKSRYDFYALNFWLLWSYKSFSAN